MHLNGLDLNLLIALDALLSEKNVTRAAERMNISQPGMSGALQKLRWHFSDQILERVGRKLQLTPKARSLAEPVKDILFHIRALTENLEQFDPGSAQRLFRIAASTFCSDLLAVPVIRLLAEIAPNISCQFDDLQIETASRLIEGRVDFAITIAHRLLDDSVMHSEALIETPLFIDRMVLIVAEGNKAIGESLTLDELCERPYAETRFGNDLLGINERVWQQQPKAPRVRAWLPNFQLTLNAVSRTDLVAMVPSRLVAAYKGRFKVRVLPVPLDIPPLEEKIFSHQRNDSDPGHLWFRDLLKRVVVEQGLDGEVA